MSDPAIRVERGTVGGITTLWTASEGPTTATLMFRVGACDESLPIAGISHFVEHMAIPTANPPRDLQHNGQVDATTTSFWATGTHDRVFAHIAEVANALGDLPVGRLETERSVLLAETDGVAPGAIGSLADDRFGARGHGIIGYPQFGLRCITGDDLRAWAARHFTRQNAVLVVRGELPNAFETNLASGVHMPPPPPEPVSWRVAPSESPRGPEGWVATGMLAERTTPAAAANGVVNQRLHARLRGDAGLSYSPTTAWIPLDADTAHFLLLADARDRGSAGAVRDAMDDVVQELLRDGPTDDELALARDIVPDGLSTADVAAHWAHYMAADLLFGREPMSFDDFQQERAALTGNLVTQALATCYDTRIVAIPPDVRRSALPELARSTDNAVSGRDYQPQARADRKELTLTAADEGITSHSRSGTFTVRFDECAIALAWRDGRRDLIGDDGTFLPVEVGRLKDGDQLTELIDRRLGSQRIVFMDLDVSSRLDSIATMAPPDVVADPSLSRAIDLLAQAMSDDETIHAICKAKVGQYPGVLAVTNWRVIFIHNDEQYRFIHRSDVAEVTTRKASRLTRAEATLTVMTNDELSLGIQVGFTNDTLERMQSALATPLHRTAGEEVTHSTAG